MPINIAHPINRPVTASKVAVTTIIATSHSPLIRQLENTGLKTVVKETMTTNTSMIALKTYRSLMFFMNICTYPFLRMFI